MSFLYPRTVSISRPISGDSGVGAQPYGGVQKAEETPVASNLPASIQLQKSQGGPEAGLPADISKARVWIFIPLPAAAGDLILERDIVTDDAGKRYQVVFPDYRSSMGHKMLCERLEA